MSLASKGTVLVTDGDSRAALAVTRSLGRAGYRVVVGERNAHCLAAASRYCSGVTEYPDPVYDESGFLSAIEKAVRQHSAAALVPVADAAVWLLAAGRDRFEPGCVVAAPAREAVEHAADKAWVVQRAAELGVPVPRTLCLSFGEDPARHAANLGFPVVIKPRRSKARTPQGWHSARVGYARTMAELAADVSRRHEGEYPLLLQERIVGPGVGVFTCIDGGTPIVWFAHRRLREKPPSGGVSVLCESTAVPARAQDDATRLLRALDWHGVAMVEFKVDSRDGSWRLMEVNGRFWGSLQLAVDAGVDFPALWISRLLGHEAAVPQGYRAGVRSRWFWGDVDSLLITLKRGEGTNGRSRAGTMVDFLKLWSPEQYYENPRWSDLGPWWHETRTWLGLA